MAATVGESPVGSLLRGVSCRFGIPGLVIMAGLAPSLLSGQTGDLIAKGEVIFQETAGGVGCQLCHGPDATGVIGPDIREKTAEDIRAAIMGVAEMDIVDLTEDEIRSVAAYLVTLRP